MRLFKVTLGLILCISILLPCYALSQDKYIDTPFENGHAKDGVKIGKWKYYGGSKNLELIIDYDSSKIDYFKKDTSNYLIKVNEEWQLKKLDRPVYHVGPSIVVYNFFALNLATSYPKKAQRDKISTVLILEIIFNENGNIISKTVLGKDKHYFEQELLKIAEDMPSLWTSAVYNNTQVCAKIGIPLIFEISNVKDRQLDYSVLQSYKGKLLNETWINAHL